LAALGAEDLLAFSRQRGAGLGRTAWNHLATALSGLYRWLDMSGHGGAHLAGAVPSRRHYRARRRALRLVVGASAPPRRGRRS
jgi:hypothetical protein